MATPARLDLEPRLQPELDIGWAAMMLARDLYTCRSILAGRPVLARKLDGLILRRALRGEPLPPADSWISVTVGMLEAVSEAGPLP